MLTVLYAGLMLISFFAWLLAPKSDLTKRIVCIQAINAIVPSVFLLISNSAIDSIGVIIGFGIPISLVTGWLFGIRVMTALNPNGSRLTYLIISAGATGFAKIIGMF